MRDVILLPVNISIYARSLGVNVSRSIKSKYPIKSMSRDRQGQRIDAERRRGLGRERESGVSQGAATMEYIQLASGGRMPMVGYGTWQVGHLLYYLHLYEFIYFS